MNTEPVSEPIVSLRDLTGRFAVVPGWWLLFQTVTPPSHSLVCVRLRHVAGTQWDNKKYMNMKHLETALEDASIAG